MIILYILLSIFVASRADPRTVKTAVRINRPLPNVQRTSELKGSEEAWITMPVDHFDPQNTDTFQMRYLYNDELFGGYGSPIFIFVGGEFHTSPIWLQMGNFYLMAQENRAHLVYAEHRYYGESLPYNDFTIENLRFLNVNQALADLAYLIQDLKRNPKFTNSKVILYGVYYGANLAIWFKQRYPHLVDGAIASSAPILSKVDVNGYFEVVHEAIISEGGEQCISTIQEGIVETVAALETEQGRRSIEEAFSLCDSLENASKYDLGSFSDLIMFTFAIAVLFNPGSLTGICNNFASDFYGNSPMEKLAGYIRDDRLVGEVLPGEVCWSIDYAYVLDLYRWNDNIRAWYYQRCTEFGHFQTVPRSGTVFDKLKWLDVDYYLNACTDAFDQRFNESFVYDAVDRFNLMFGGLEPDVNNTINLHGAIDPWHILGVYERDLKETSPTFTVPRATHGFDLIYPHETQTAEVTDTLAEVRRLVKQWIT